MQAFGDGFKCAYGYSLIRLLPQPPATLAFSRSCFGFANSHSRKAAACFPPFFAHWAQSKSKLKGKPLDTITANFCKRQNVLTN